MLSSLDFGFDRHIDELSKLEKIGIFGASVAASEVIDYLSSINLRAECFFDSSSEKQGGTLYDMPIRSPEALVEFSAQGGGVVIASAYQSEIAEQIIDGLGVDPHRVFPFLSKMFRDHYGKEAVEPYIKDIEGLVDRCSDVSSKEYVRSLMKFRWAMDPRLLMRNAGIVGSYEYNHEDLSVGKGARIIDCGAFTGDTARLYLDRLQGDAKIVALEPVGANFLSMCDWIVEGGFQHNVCPIKCAVGETRGSVRIETVGESVDPWSSIGEGKGELVQVASLDDLWLAKGGRVDLLKIDIEGFERAALRGAGGLLRRDHPVLAIAAYHLFDDLWELPKLIDSICPGYRFFIGHHASAVYECEIFAHWRPSEEVA